MDNQQHLPDDSFIREFLKGQAGGNQGLSMGDGLKNVSDAVNGVLKGMTYGVAAAAKVGKSTITDYGFILSPLEDAQRLNIPINWIYFSFEMDRISKMFDFLCYYLYTLYNIHSVQLPKGCTVKNKNSIELSSTYLRGRLTDDQGRTVLIDPKIKDLIKVIKKEKLDPLFGIYNKKNLCIKEGLITFIEQKENPTGLRNRVVQKAEEDGFFTEIPFIGTDGKTYKKKVGYTANNPAKFTIIITDTIRKLRKERGFTLKETIDKWLEYATELRNLCGYTFVHIVHLNRSVSDVSRLKYAGDELFPTPEDIKDTGNLSEECNFLFTMFNPNDTRYHLTSHFGVNIKDSKGNPLYPGMKTLHLVESREVESPQHFRFEMLGNVKSFRQYSNKKFKS